MIKDLYRRIRTALLELGKECKSQEGVAILLVTSILVARHALGSAKGLMLLSGITGAMAQIAPLLSHQVMQRQVIAVLLQLLVPFMAIWLIHRRKLTDFGLGLGDLKFWLPITGVIFAIQVVVIAFYLSKDPVYILRYPTLAPARNGGFVFWAWEGSRIAYMISWEFMFRGYLLFALKDRLGMLSCFVSMVPFVLMHIISGKPISEVTFTIFSGLLSAVFVLESRSVWPVIWLHAMGALLLDVFIVYR